MRIIKKDNHKDKFLVESSKSTPQKKSYYEVDIEKKECDCPHFRIRLKRTGEECKHIKAVRELLYNDAKDEFQKALEYIDIKFEVDSIDFIEKFGEGLLNELIEQGELIEDKGMIKRLE